VAVDTERSADRSTVNVASEPDAPSTQAGQTSGRLTVVRPASRWPRLDIAELWHYRELLRTFVWRDLKVRYKQTSIGVAWALFVPIFTAAVYILFLGKFAKAPRGSTNYTILVFAGVLPMQYFSSALTGSSASIVAGVNLVTRVYFPRVLLPLASTIVPVVDFFFGFVVMLGLMAWTGTWPNGINAVLAPAFLALAFVTALGAGLFLSAVNVRYRDVVYAIPVFMQVLPFLSGVLFDVSHLPTKWQWILAINPMTAVIAGWRWTMLGSSAPNVPQTAVGVVVGILLFLFGLAFFRRSEPRFADTI
jgi:lipopolysaccharide transport system permease protein